MDSKIIEKPLVFLGFFNILRKSLEVFGNALGEPLGTPWGALGDAWGSLGDAWGGLGDALGKPQGDLGNALGDPLGEPWENLGRTSLEDPPGRPNIGDRTWARESS